MPDSLPSHHDDHHGGVDGHTAHRFGFRRWRRFQASTGTGSSRRARFFAGGDAVSDTRFLHLYGSFPKLGREPFRDTKPETERSSFRRTLLGRLTLPNFEDKFFLSFSFASSCWPSVQFSLLSKGSNLAVIEYHCSQATSSILWIWTHR